MIELFLPFPPSINVLYNSNRYGIYLSKKGRLYVERMEAEVQAQCGSVPLPISYFMQVDVILYPPDRRKRDIDNYTKCLFDSLTKAGLWKDDSLVQIMKVYKGEKTSGGLAYMRIRPADSGIVPLSKVGL